MTQAAQTHQPNTLASRAVGRVLVLDDDANLRFIYKQALRHAGYEVYSAETTQKAQTLLASYQFDVFIADTHLNGRDQGIDLLCEQAAELNKSGTHIIIMSCDAQYLQVCQEIGVDLFIEKPLAIDRLVALVDRLVGQQ